MSLLTQTRMLALAVALATGVASVVPAFAQETPPPQQRQPGGGGPGGRGPGGGGGAGGPQQSLENNMKAMNRAFKTIGRQIDDATKDESTLKLVSDLQAATAAAKGQLPDQLAKLEGEAKAKAAADYRKQMMQALKEAIELEEALVGGNREGAKAAYAKIDQQMKEGHKAYRVQDH